MRQVCEIVLEAGNSEDDDGARVLRSLKPQLDALDYVQWSGFPEASASEAGAKGLDQGMLTLGVALLVNALPAFFHFLSTYVSRPGPRPVTIHLKVKGHEVKVSFDPMTTTPDSVSKLADELARKLST